jgi:hypothetical protein
MSTIANTHKKFEIKNVSLVSVIDEHVMLTRLDVEIPKADEIMAVIDKACDKCRDDMLMSAHVLAEFRLLCYECLFGDMINATFTLRTDNDDGRYENFYYTTLRGKSKNYIFLWKIRASCIVFDLSIYRDVVDSIYLRFDMNKLGLDNIAIYQIQSRT